MKKINKTKKLLMKFLSIIFIFVLTIVPAKALENLNFNGFIADNAQVISEQKEKELNSILLDLQNKTKADIAVVTLKSLENRPIEEVALNIGRKYKIGDKKLNNGAVVLVVPQERQARIEVGYGLEGDVTDSQAGNLMDTYMIPYFKDNNYEQGIVDGTTALAIHVAKAYGCELSAKEPSAPIGSNTDDSLSIIIFIIIFVILIIISSNKKGGSGGGGGSYRNSSSSFSSSSSSSFGGGGGFGGGGSSRSW